ncbi:HAMP domain-containing sensor histidine kinase [Fusobacterium sp.]|uniref:sensor histidine kinase n=1 Tax=Fusobacterium sp. TaxID=68766 RepID=UPI00260F5AF4|nr:HAMP domain-containing sensor histidine kinase [Fusobacterium sp.]
MRKLSEELRKSYRVFLFLFMFSYLGIMSFFAFYIKSVSHADIETTNGFINYETNEFEAKLKSGRNLVELFEDALDECPKIIGVSVIFKYDGKIYTKNHSSNLVNLTKDKNFSEKIQSIGFYKYEFLYREIKVNNLKPIEVIIIKDMHEDREIIMGIIKFFISLIAFTLFLNFYLAKKFYNRFIPPLKNLQEITNNINLDTLDHNLETKNTFIEFDTVITSYKNMLKRIKSQTDAQIDFVNNASHELKTPIFIISGYVNLVKRWGFENKEILKEALDSIDDETKNMSSLVSKLLFLAKDNINDIDHINFDVAEVIKNTINDLNIIYPNQKINFSYKKAIINSDFNLVKQLFLNLIENAIKYGKGNEIDINIFYNKNITVEIKDRGEGISKENLNHIYDKFFRVDKARSRNMKSHGLGLSIVKKITEVLNIDMNIESELGKGTTIKVTLPLS